MTGDGASTSDGPDDGPDPSTLFFERSELAWTRTGLALLTAVAVVVRRVTPVLDRTGIVLGASLVGAAVLLAVVGVVHQRRVELAADELLPRLQPLRLRAASLGAFTLAVAAFGTGLAPPP